MAGGNDHKSNPEVPGEDHKHQRSLSAGTIKRKVLQLLDTLSYMDELEALELQKIQNRLNRVVTKYLPDNDSIFNTILLQEFKIISNDILVTPYKRGIFSHTFNAVFPGVIVQ